MKIQNKQFANDISENTTKKNWKSGSILKHRKAKEQGSPKDIFHSSPVDDLLTTPLLTGKISA